MTVYNPDSIEVSTVEGSTPGTSNFILIDYRDDTEKCTSEKPRTIVDALYINGKRRSTTMAAINDGIGNRVTLDSVCEVEFDRHEMDEFGGKTEKRAYITTNSEVKNPPKKVQI